MPKISPNRIVCPASAWRFLENEPHKTCHSVYCCWYCPKRSKCKDSNGCRKRVLPFYPEKCNCYPLTFEEAQRILFLCKLFDERFIKEPCWSYIYYSQMVEEFIKGKKFRLLRKKHGD